MGPEAGTVFYLGRPAYLHLLMSVCLCYSMALAWTLAAVPMNMNLYLYTRQRPEYMKKSNESGDIYQTKENILESLNRRASWRRSLAGLAEQTF
jgi:hypothetical protein